jgi:hypothetical protein
MSDTATRFATACVEATKQWHQKARTYEAAARQLAVAQHELQLAERDLHELGRALAVVNGAAPHAPSREAVAVPEEGDAAAEVLRIMQGAQQSGVMP